MDNLETSPSCPDRRGFLKKLAANVIGAVITIVPFGAGLAVLLDPARRRSDTGGQTVRVASLNSIPEDGVPRKFTVFARRVDAWNQLPEASIGAVYLRRQKGGQPQAFSAVCPHTGCFVDFIPARGSYLCPCHNSTFAVNGTINAPNSPARRGLDELVVEVRNGTEVWVRYQTFRAGLPQKIPT